MYHKYVFRKCQGMAELVSMNGTIWNAFGICRLVLHIFTARPKHTTKESHYV